MGLVFSAGVEPATCGLVIRWYMPVKPTFKVFFKKTATMKVAVND